MTCFVLLRFCAGSDCATSDGLESSARSLRLEAGSGWANSPGQIQAKPTQALARHSLGGHLCLQRDRKHLPRRVTNQLVKHRRAATAEAVPFGLLLRLDYLDTLVTSAATNQSVR